MQRHRFLRTISVMVLLFVVATAMYAFTAENTFADDNAGNAGIGAGDVSGYEISNIAYTFDADPATIASVAFDLDAAAGSVMARGDNGDWVTCTATNNTSTAWSCPIDVETEGFEELEVAAAD
jgi:hypothetical protein